MRQVQAVPLAIAAVVVASLAAASLAVVGGNGAGAPIAPALPSETIPASQPEPSSPPVAVIRGFAVNAEIRRPPTAHKAQSKLWYHDGFWWGLMLQPDSRAFHVYRLDPSQAWIDTGTLVDERIGADPDALSAGDHLYVASAVDTPSSAGRARVARFSYDREVQRYSLDPNFPIELTEAGVESIVIARDSRGILWVTYTQGELVHVNHTLDRDELWADPFILPVAGTNVDGDDISTIVAYAGDRVGILWTNQRDDAIYFSSRRDGDPPTEWSPAETALSGHRIVDDHLNAKTTSDGRIFVAMKTSQDELVNPSARAPLTALLVREADGTWGSYLFGRVRDRHTRPIVILDESAGYVYFIAASGRMGTVYYKRTPLDAPAFSTGRGIPLIQSPDDVHIGDPTSTKQNVTADSGMIVLAWDGSTNRYLHAVVDVGRGLPSAPGEVDAPVSSSGQTVLLRDDFNVWKPGDAVANGWIGAHGASLAIAPGRNAEDRSVRILGVEDGARGCKAFVLTPTGTIEASVRVRTDPTSRVDAVITAIRGSEGDTASVRFGQGGTFSYFSGGIKERTEVIYRPGAWYRSIVRVDLDAKRFAWELRSDDGQQLFLVENLPWRTPVVGSVSQICLSAGDVGSALFFDDVIISR